MKRNNTIKLTTNRETDKTLRELGIMFAKCWNEVNYLRTQQYKKREKIDFEKTEKETYQKYKAILKVNAQQVARKNAEAWKSFLQLTKKKKEGELPKWFKPRPPNYWKNKHKPILLIRNDRYTINEEKNEIYLKDYKITLKYKGMLKWRGKQGRLEIIYNEARRHWYAHIPAEFQPNTKPKGQLRASVDLGIVNLATVCVEDGSWMMFKGGSVLSQYEHYSKKISTLQKILSRHKQRKSRRLKLLYEKRRLFLKHALNSMVRKIVSTLHEKGVSMIIVGHPKGITRNHGNKLTVNFWNYAYVLRRFHEISEEFGIRIVEVCEAYSSRSCSLCGEAHENGRIKRGLYKCPRTEEIINADLNGGINMLHIPESLGAGERGVSFVRDRGNWLKAQPAVYRWTSGAGWVLKPTSHDAMKMNTVNREPVNRPRDPLVL